MRNLLLILTLIYLGSVYSIAQTIVSYKTHVLCQQDNDPQVAISNIVFDAPGSQDVVITGVTYPNPGSVFVAGFPINEVAASQVMLKTNVSGPFGVFDVTIAYKIVGSPQILTHVFQVEIAESITVTPSSSARVCRGDDQLDLNTLVDYPGGQFSVNQTLVPNGVLNLDGFTVNDNYFIYYYLYEDDYGCTSYASSAVSFDDSPLIILDNKENTACSSSTGEIHLDVTTPSGTFEGYWNNGVQNSTSIVGLSAGDYYYKVIDSDGCTAQFSTIVETDNFYIADSIDHVKCKGGTDGKIRLYINGGSGDYNIFWSSGHGSSTVTGLSAGTYSVRVVDVNNGCEVYKDFVVTEPATAFEASFDVYQPNSCGSTEGGIGGFYSSSPLPFNFLWSTGETTDYISDLTAGHYTVQVTDGNGCVFNKGFDVNETNAPDVSVKVLHPNCGGNDGYINLEEVNANSVGASILGYSWSNGSVTRNVNGLTEGSYTVTISQSDGCVGVYTYELIENPYKYVPEICIVTVDTATNTNLIVWEKEAGNPNNISYYNIYRANAVSGDFQKVGFVNYGNISVFNDVVASPEKRSWVYKISAVNTCGQESRLSKHHKTIHLVMNDGPVAGEKKLTWDHYEGLQYFYYNLYRGTNVDGWQLIQGNISIITLPDFTNVLPAGATEVDYIVEVIPTGGGCTATFNKVQDYNSSRSNKPSPIFNPGFGTGGPNNSVASFEYDEFKALVYPNPSNGDFKIEITDNLSNQILNMTILGVNGNIVHQQSLNNDLNTVHLNADAGLYFVQIQGETTLETIRIIIK